MSNRKFLAAQAAAMLDDIGSNTEDSEDSGDADNDDDELSEESTTESETD